MLGHGTIGGDGRFPETRWSAVVAARSDDPAERRRALDILIGAYWKPVYKYIRIHWNKSADEAQDLTQDFFTRLLEKDFLDRYDPARARLRTYLRVCVDGVVANEAKAAHRLKRGGDAIHISLDFSAAETELSRVAPAARQIASPETIDDWFDKEWVRSLFALAVESLREECERSSKQVHFRLFEIYDLEDAPDRRPSYDDLAREFAVGVTDVTNYLAFARREFRRIVLATLRDVCASEDEFRREARSILGVDLR
ncbi:MAG: sigma factor [Candidatus Acidiferrales bacterium]|jgi:RNA polymerase sigma factor (sigma-70 family)